MKQFTYFFIFFSLMRLPLQAQIEEVNAPKGASLSFNEFLNGTTDGKIKTIDLSQVNDNWDRKPYNESTSKYLCAIYGWNEEEVKMNILGVLNIGGYGYLYFYTLIHDKALPTHQVRFGVRLLRNEQFYDYKIGPSPQPMIYARSDDADDPKESLLIKINKVGKKTSFTVTSNSEVVGYETTYTLLLDEAGSNNKWISSFTKMLKK